MDYLEILELYKQNQLGASYLVFELLKSYGKQRDKKIIIDLGLNPDRDGANRSGNFSWSWWSDNIKNITNVVRQRFSKNQVMERRECKKECQACGESFVGYMAAKYCGNCIKKCKYCNREHEQKGTVCGSCRNKKYVYNLTHEEMYAWLNSTNCDCCGKEFSDNNHRDRVQDHDHTDGSNRGIICQRCNIAVGYYETTDQRMLLNYLNKFI